MAREKHDYFIYSAGERHIIKGVDEVSDRNDGLRLYRDGNEIARFKEWSGYVQRDALDDYAS